MIRKNWADTTRNAYADTDCRGMRAVTSRLARLNAARDAAERRASASPHRRHRLTFAGFNGGRVRRAAALL